LNAANNWTASFTDLDKYSNKKEIQYTVEEVTDNGYKYNSAITGTMKDGFTITNTLVTTSSVTGTKIWDDNDNQDGIRPDTVTFKLQMKVGDGDWTDVTTKSGDENVAVTTTATADKDGNWSYSFENLPAKYNGENIQYGVVEINVKEGYTPSYVDNDDHLKVKNTHAPGKISVSVEKVWDDQENIYSTRPESITVKLQEKVGDATEFSDVTTKSGDKDVPVTVELNANNNWKASFANLDQFSNGQKIEYTVLEEKEVGYKTPEITGDMSNGFTITNKLDTTNISVTKTWEDNDDQDGIRPGNDGIIPDSITFTLQKEVKDENGKTSSVDVTTKSEDKDVPVTATVQADEDGFWSYTFNDLT
jgi:hypothetical protein